MFCLFLEEKAKFTHTIAIMNRKAFLKTLALLPLTGFAMKLTELNKISQTLKPTQKMPALFLGHGNPMNAIEENEFVRGFRTIADELPTPQAILCISAHWETRGTFVTAMEMPKTIHDFGGFPPELYNVQYPAPGMPALAKETQRLIKTAQVELDNSWGLDHGAWSVIKHLYPQANIPVIQLSLDYRQSPQFHYNLAQELEALRHKGILIIGSGNMVHNLRMVAWDRISESGFGFDWALEAQDLLKQLIMSGDHKQLINYRSLGKAVDLSIPTPEHFLPLLYVLGTKDDADPVLFFNDKAVAGSLTMTSLKI